MKNEIGVARPRSFSPMRAAAASTLSFVLVGVACGGKTTGDARPASGGVAASTAGGAGEAGQPPSTGGSGGIEGSCTTEQLATFKADLLQALPAEVANCLYVGIDLHPSYAPDPVYYSFGYSPNPPGSSGPVLGVCSMAPYPHQSDLDQALASIPVPACRAEYEEGTSLHGAQEGELATILDRIMGCDVWDAYTRIEIDAAGNVVGVSQPSAANQEEAQAVAECVQAALAGLTFPCLGGSTVCSDYVLF